jgi:hypothetical protein
MPLAGLVDAPQHQGRTTASCLQARFHTGQEAARADADVLYNGSTKLPGGAISTINGVAVRGISAAKRRLPIGPRRMQEAGWEKTLRGVEMVGQKDGTMPAKLKVGEGAIACFSAQPFTGSKPACLSPFRNPFKTLGP